MRWTTGGWYVHVVSFFPLSFFFYRFIRVPFFKAIFGMSSVLGFFYFILFYAVLVVLACGPSKHQRNWSLEALWSIAIIFTRFFDSNYMSITYIDGVLIEFELVMRHCCYCHLLLCLLKWIDQWNRLLTRKKNLRSNEQQIDESVNRYRNLLHGISNVSFNWSLVLSIASDSF